MNIFVGNLSYQATDEDLREAFEAYGEVASACVIIDKFTGKSRGFGFVEMPNAEEGQRAIEALNNREIKGRPVKVNEARPREERPPRRHFEESESHRGYRDRGPRRGRF